MEIVLRGMLKEVMQGTRSVRCLPYHPELGSKRTVRLELK